MATKADWQSGMAIAVVGGLVGLILVGCVIAAVEDEKKWKTFSAQHNCQKTQETQGRSGVGLGSSSSGQAVMVTTYTPGQIGFKCDDGITYWRDK